MNQVMQWMTHDTTRYGYLLEHKEEWRYSLIRFAFMLFMGLIGVLLAVIKRSSLPVCIVCAVGFTYGGYKLPWLWLRLRHNQRCRQISDAIILWVNTIYALIGENNIYNAISLSYASAPEILKPDLECFIQQITLYEYRSLSKDKLKYEIAALTKALSRIERDKRERRYRSELFTADTLTMIMMSVPCMYMFFVSLILSQLIMS